MSNTEAAGQQGEFIPDFLFSKLVDEKVRTWNGRAVLLNYCAEYLDRKVRDNGVIGSGIITRVLRVVRACADSVPLRLDNECVPDRLNIFRLVEAGYQARLRWEPPTGGNLITTEEALKQLGEEKRESE